MPWWTRIGIVFCAAFLTWILLGCSPDTPDELEEFEAGEVPPVEQLYNRALDMMTTGKYEDAIEAFELVEQEYPFSDWAKRSQVMAGYAAYRGESFDEAALILDRFVKLHPNNEQTAYAYYLKALTYYNQIVDVGRDQETTRKARQALREVVARFPETDYARDARLKLELTEDHLAGKEMEIGRYYLSRDEYLAALGRFQHVITHYQTTSHTAEALHRLVETYLLLGVKPEAQKYAAVLGYNFPGSDWYDFSYKLLNGDVNPEGVDRNSAWYQRLFPSL